MPSRKPLSDVELERALDGLPGWSLEAGKLHRTFRFRDFAAAFAFMTDVALRAQALDHHPEWFQIWHTVKVWLVTHEPHGITALDVTLAAAIDACAGHAKAHRDDA